MREAALLSKLRHPSILLQVAVWYEQHSISCPAVPRGGGGSNPGGWSRWAGRGTHRIWQSPDTAQEQEVSSLLLCVPWSEPYCEDYDSGRDGYERMRRGRSNDLAEPKTPYATRGGIDQQSSSLSPSKAWLRLISYQLYPPGLPLDIWLGAHGQVGAQRQLTSIIFSCAKALEHLHACGIIHNAVEPESLWVRDDGDIVLGNLSRASPAGSPPFNNHHHAPANLFISPEARLGELVDCHSDMYALGMLWMWLTMLAAVDKSNMNSSEATAFLREHFVASSAGISTFLTEYGYDVDPLLVQLLSVDSYERPDAFEVVAILKERGNTDNT